MRFKMFVIFGISLILLAGCGSIAVNATAKVNSDTISDNLKSIQILPNTISIIKAPEIKTPDWLQAQMNAEQAAASRQSSYSGSTVYYSVETRGIITANLSEFKSLANQTLNDSRGWSRIGVGFQEVASGGSFTLVLSDASQVPSFAPAVCSIYWSCQVGRYVIINQDRWLGASDAWNSSGGSLRDYRNMVVSHETGHWLGHGHLYVCGTAQKAPVMMQQSINLNGCTFNPWPLDNELWSSTLGIS